MSKIIAFKHKIDQLITPIRLWDWWEFKTPTFLGVAYLVALHTDLAFEQLGFVLLNVIIALIPVASFVSVINDIADEAEDLRAGKHNTMQGRTKLFKVGWLVFCLLGGGVGFWMLSASTIAMVLYLLNWIVFVLYSVPPIRLKTRGMGGVLADACGGQLLPTLWTAFIVAAAAQKSLSSELIILLSTWALALGLRCILAHQLADICHDQQSNTQTLAVRLGIDSIKKWVSYGIFPVEIASLGLLLLQTASPVAWLMSGLFVSGQWFLAQQKSIPLVLVAPQKGCWFVLFRYYITFFPLCFIPALAQQSVWAVLLIFIHLVLFPGSWGLQLKTFFQ